MAKASTPAPASVPANSFEALLVSVGTSTTIREGVNILMNGIVSAIAAADPEPTAATFALQHQIKGAIPQIIAAVKANTLAAKE